MTSTQDLIESLRVVSPPGRRPEVDAALAHAERVAEHQAQAVSQLEDAVQLAGPASPLTVVGALLDGTATAAEVVQRAATPALTPEAVTALLDAADRTADQRMAQAVETAADALPETWASDALSTPWAAWGKASRTLAGLLREHGVQPDPAALLEAPVPVLKGWRAATAAARATLEVAAHVAAVEGDVEGGPTANPWESRVRWWTPTGGDALDRARQMLTWDPAAGPLELLPVRADEHGVTLALVDWATAKRRSSTWQRCQPASTTLDRADAQAQAYGRPAVLTGDARDLVARVRGYSDGLPTAVASAA